jgi:hypothetical protein
MTTTVPIYDAMGNVTGFQEADTPTTDTSGNVTPLQLDYYRNKVKEFQDILDNMDATAAIARYTIDEDISPELTQSLQDYLASYDAKKGEFRVAAEALNFAIAGANAIGGGFPTVNIPAGLAGLGFIPLAAGAAVAGALAVAAALIVWGREWIKGVNERMKQESLIKSVPEDKRAALAQSIVQTDATVKASEASPLTSIAGIVKWGAIAIAAYFAFQAFNKSRG